MTSVWKRLQRVGKNASKFQFTASYQSLTVECVRSGKWQPNKLVVVWTRRKRRKATKPQSWQPGISNPFRGVLVWPEPVPVEVVVTLYKDPRPNSEFEDKEWMFIIEDESVGGRRKPIATASINMADYVSTCYATMDVSLTMKIVSKKVLSATLDLQLSSILLKQGKATDADMMSIASMMSLNDIGCLEDFDGETEENLALRLGRVRKTSLTDTPSPVLKSKGGGGNGSNSPSPVIPARKKHSRSKSLSAPTRDGSLTRSTAGSDDSGSTASGQELAGERSHAEAALMEWCKSCTQGYAGVKIKNVTTSFRDGLAFCAILHHFHPELIDFDSLEKADIQGNNEKALDLFTQLGVPRLLDPTDMMFSKVPDKLSVMTYLFQVRTFMTSPPQRKPAEPNPPAPVDSGSLNPFLDDDVEMEEESVDKGEMQDSSATDQGKTSSSFDSNVSTLAAETKAPSFKKVDDCMESKTRTTETRNEGDEQNAQVKTNLEQEPSYPDRLNPFGDDEEFSETESNNRKEKPDKPGKSDEPDKDLPNPFEEDETDEDQTDASLKARGSYPKEFNPFDEDDECEETDSKEEARKRESYPDDLNPFGSDDSIEETAKGGKETVSPGYNPFEEDSLPADRKPIEQPKVARRRRPAPAARHVASRAVATPSDQTANKSEVSEQRSSVHVQAPAPDAGNPWTTRLPEKAGSRRRRASPAKADNRADSPSKRAAPRRPAPRPPRPKDAFVKETGSEAGGETAKQSLQKDSGPKSDDGQEQSDGKEAAQDSGKDDIKLRAHQLLMEAREKAGASKALPRERLAEIRAQKLRKEPSPTGEGDGQPEGGRNEAEGTIGSAESHQTQNRELGRAETNINKHKPAQAMPTNKNNDDAAVANKNVTTDGDSRPAKPGTTTTKGKRRAPAPPPTANRGTPRNEARAMDDKPEFQESEELRRIRTILNQSKAIQPKAEPTASQRSSSKTEAPTSPGPQDKTDKGDDAAAQSPRGGTYGLGHAAAAEAYAESRKMKFDSAVVIAPRQKPPKQPDSPNRGPGSKPQSMAPPPKPPRLFIAESENENQEREAPTDKGKMIRRELKALEEEQQALDKVAGKLEKELRTAMSSKGCKDEEEKLMQEWLILINKKNDLVSKQNELALLEKEYLLEQQIEQLNSELRILLEKEDSKKTESERKREDDLIKEIVALVDQKDHLVRLEDSISPEPAISVEQVKGVLAKQKNECVVQ